MRLWQVFTSTVAAFFGVQTDKQRQQDFSHSSPLPFILMGIIVAIAMVLTLIFIVAQVVN